MTDPSPSEYMVGNQRHPALSLDDLTVGLASVFAVSPREVEVVDRHFNLYSTSSPSEIITCQLATSRRETILLKRGSASRGSDKGYWGGLLYEAGVYRQVLEPLGVRTPRLFGTFVDHGGIVSSVIEYIDGALRAYQDPEQQALVEAAAWIGRFHRRSAAIDDDVRQHLKRYDRRYYVGWAVRTLELADPDLQHAWLAPLCRMAQDLIAELAARPAPVIHGEYYASNVLVRDHRIYPVDWETAAIAPGEIDLVALVDDWPSEMAAECRKAYVEARWDGQAPHGFERTLDLSALYLHLRWLGDQPERTREERAAGRYERLHLVGTRLGLIRLD
jgi:hypothetical protein